MRLVVTRWLCFKIDSAGADSLLGVVAAALPLFGTMAARRTAWAWVAVALLASAELPPAVRRGRLRGLAPNASGVRRLQYSPASHTSERGDDIGSWQHG